MHDARIRQEIQPRDGVSDEKVVGEHVPFHAIAGRTSDDQDAWGVCAALCQWEDVVDRRHVELQPGATVDAAAATVAQHGPLDRTLVPPLEDMMGAAGKSAGGSGEGDSVKAMLWHDTSPRRATPSLGVRFPGWASQG